MEHGDAWLLQRGSELIKEKYHRATFVNYLAHQPNLIISNIMKNGNDASVAFEPVNKICNFWPRCNKDRHLEEII